MTPAVYVVSKVKHSHLWRTLKFLGVPINSSWIGFTKEEDLDFFTLWPLFLKEASSCQAVLVYIEPGEQLKGGIAEIGAALAAGATVFLAGEVPDELRTLSRHPEFQNVGDLDEALILLQNFLLLKHDFCLWKREDNLDV